MNFETAFAHARAKNQRVFKFKGKPYNTLTRDELVVLFKADKGLAAVISAAEKFCKLLEDIDHRCMASDGPVPATLTEASPSEVRTLYEYADKIRWRHP